MAFLAVPLVLDSRSRRYVRPWQCALATRSFFLVGTCAGYVKYSYGIAASAIAWYAGKMGLMWHG
jgi:hypothetical protein